MKTKEATDITKDYSKKNPYASEILENIRLTKKESGKQTHHLVLSLKDSGIVYEPGDSLAVFPNNNPEYVEAFILQAGFDPKSFVITPENEEVLLTTALAALYDINSLTKSFISAYGKLFGYSEVNDLVKNENEFQLLEYQEKKDLLDFITEFPLPLYRENEFIKILRPLKPRLYSIASSQLMYPEEAHLTVVAVKYEILNRFRHGVCSTYLSERADKGEIVQVFLQKNKEFKLPSPEKNIIMVGPGTGIAPFRAFLQERKIGGAKGKNWLFFGERNKETDFLYQNELEEYLEEGLLTRLDTAFSRDQENKIYVQDRMKESSSELFKWLEEGAIFYVCGDAARMAKDVQETLLQIIEKEGKKDREEAEKYLKQLKSEKRYLRDVY